MSRLDQKIVCIRDVHKTYVIYVSNMSKVHTPKDPFKPKNSTNIFPDVNVIN